MSAEEKPTQATILHVDMDAFFASVAEKDNPSLKGKAVVIGMGTRGVVSAANYEARKFGIHSAMPVGQARRLAPHAIFLPVDMARYQEVSGHIMEIFESFTPNVEPVSVDEAFLDVTGAKKLLGTGREIAAAIRAKVEEQEGITCSVGIAPSKFIAKLASGHCKPNGILEIPADRILNFLHPLPVNAIWGVGPKTAEKLINGVPNNLLWSKVIDIWKEKCGDNWEPFFLKCANCIYIRESDEDLKPLSFEELKERLSWKTTDTGLPSQTDQTTPSDSSMQSLDQLEDNTSEESNL